MKKSFLTLSAFLLLAGFSACTNNTDTTTTTTTDTTMTAGDTGSQVNGGMNAGASNNSSYSSNKLNASDSAFVMKAAEGGMAEVQGGQVAQQNAQNDRVKNFGQMMVTDHGQANQQLQNMLQAKGMSMPNDLPMDKQQMLNKMKNMHGASFDKSYMRDMVDDHQKDVDDFQKQANMASDPDVRAWAAQALPVLRKHLDSAKAINSALK